MNAGGVQPGHGYTKLESTVRYLGIEVEDALEMAMSSQALGSERVRNGLKDILLGPAQLYEALRAKGGEAMARA